MKFYYKYMPVRRGLTGSEYIAQWLMTTFPTITWRDVISDGDTKYGFISGTGDEFSKAVQAIEGRFSAQRLQEHVFFGMCKMIFDKIPEIIGPIDFGIPKYTFDQLLDDFDAPLKTDTYILYCVKSAKKNLFKEISKRVFDDNNDSIADLAKSIVAISLHYDDMSEELKDQVDGDIILLKSIYTPEVAAHGLHVLVASLQNILVDYYTAIQQVDAAQTVDAVTDIIYK